MHPQCILRSKLREGFNTSEMLLWIWRKCLRPRLIFSPFLKSNPHLIASLTPWHALLWKPCWGNHNMVSVLWRAQPPENIHFTHQNEKAVMPVCTWRGSKGLWEKECLSSSQQSEPIVLNFVLSFYHFFVWTSTKQNKWWLVCSRPQWQEKASAQRGICGTVLWRKRFRGDGGTQKHNGRQFLGYRGKAHIRFLLPLNRGRDAWGRGTVLLSWSLSFLGPGHVITAWLLTR